MTCAAGRDVHPRMAVVSRSGEMLKAKRARPRATPLLVKSPADSASRAEPNRQSTAPSRRHPNRECVLRRRDTRASAASVIDRCLALVVPRHVTRDCSAPTTMSRKLAPPRRCPGDYSLLEQRLNRTAGVALADGRRMIPNRCCNRASLATTQRCGISHPGLRLSPSRDSRHALRLHQYRLAGRAGARPAWHRGAKMGRGRRPLSSRRSRSRRFDPPSGLRTRPRHRTGTGCRSAMRA